jgi:hypothetical protein
MPSKLHFGVTLWAIPRFHRPEFEPEHPVPERHRANRPKTYSFPVVLETEEKTPTMPGEPERCH